MRYCIRFSCNRNCIVGPRGAKLSKTLTEVSTSRLLNKKLKLNIQTTAFFIFIKSFPDGLGTRTPKPDNQHSVNSQHGADGEERSSQPGEGWQLFTRPLLPEGSSLQVGILFVCLSVCTSSLQHFRSMAFKSSQNDVRPHILYTIGSSACLVMSGACLVVSGGV